LTWHDTDGNIIKGPNAADLDLHFVHPNAVGVDGDLDGTPDGFFDLVYDCFWYNSVPTWSEQDPNANPSLSSDASSEGGPEITLLQSPEDGLSYRVGVHYYPGVSTAPQIATLKVYSQEQALWESPEVTLSPGDLWDAAILDWPQKLVTPNESASGVPKVIPNYPAPF
jgi:hypothetical protein